METRLFPKIEDRISGRLQQLTKDILLENLTAEAKFAFEDANDYAQWQHALKDPTMVLGLAKYPKIDRSFDMGWQQQSSGNRYASLSGDALLVGCKTRKPIALVVKSKICNFCKSWAVKMKKNNIMEDVDPPPHDCKKNHDGTSGAMESIACLDMVIDMFESKHVTIHRICCDDDASTRSMLRWSNEDYMANTGTTVAPMVAKTKGVNAGALQARPNKGKLPGKIPEPTFLTDPNHQKKVFTGDLYKLLSAKGVANRFTITNMDINRLGTGFGYMIRSLRKKPKAEWEHAAAAVLEHHLDNHKYCGAWCPCKRQTLQQRQESRQYYRNKEKDAKLYEAVQKIICCFITPERLEEVAHGYDTQINESFNNTASWFAPKNKVYCGLQLLEDRLSMAVGINSIGIERYFTRLFTVLKITTPPCVTHYLSIKEINQLRRQRKRKQQQTKKDRKKKMYENLRNQEQHAKRDFQKREGTYKKGQNLDEDGADGCTHQELLDAATVKPLVCPFRKKTGHSTVVEWLRVDTQQAVPTTQIEERYNNNRRTCCVQSC
jgi:hypothetical protein